MSRHFFILCISLICASSAFAEDIVVVMNNKSSVDKLSRDEVVDVYMGRSRKLSSGVTALPLDLPITAVEREEFYSRLTGKSANQINAYWARLILTGRASPPKEMHSQDELNKTITNNDSAIAYMNRRAANSTLKVLLELNEK